MGPRPRSARMSLDSRDKGQSSNVKDIPLRPLRVTFAPVQSFCRHMAVDRKGGRGTSPYMRILDPGDAPRMQVHLHDVSERSRNTRSGGFGAVVGRETVEVVAPFLNKTVSWPTSLRFLGSEMLITVQQVVHRCSDVLSLPPASEYHRSYAGLRRFSPHLHKCRRSS